MVSAFLAAPPLPGAAGRPEPAPQVAIRRLTIESLDGRSRIPLDGSTGWWRIAGSTGLEMPPVDVATAAVPGVAGTALQDVRVAERPVAVPLFTTSGGGHIDHLDMLDAIRSLIDPTVGQFRLIGSSARGERELVAVYTGGLEGSDGRDESGIYWRKFGLQAVACQPFAQARTDRVVEFAASGAGGAFLGAAGGTDAPWPRALSSSAVVGDNMSVTVASEVPVYPTVELVGPMDSFTGTVSLADATMPPFYGGTTWSVSIPAGVPAGQTFRMVTDPRAKSFRLNGALAAGRVARGSQLTPFFPGLNVMSVSAPGSNENTRVRISWRELHRSLW